jgi:transcriptional regulator with XRE-family HTH domain
MSQLGVYVVLHRRRRGWSRAELARQANLPYTTIRNIEKSERAMKPHEETIHALATALECDEGEMRIVAGYQTVASLSAEVRNLRAEALLRADERLRAAVEAIEQLSPDEQDTAISLLEAHLRNLADRRRRRRSP